MVEAAEICGRLNPGATIVEPTSGNTGIGLAMVAASKGYRLVLTMPETMSQERRTLLKALGAEVVLTEGAQGMKGAIAKAEELLAANPGFFMPRQFSNVANPAVHERTTGPEIWDDTAGKIDILVAGVGTGGTLTGCARCLKRLKPSLKVVAVEPESSPVLSGGEAASHKVQGIGAGFVPDNYDAGLVDEVYKASDVNAGKAARDAARLEGIFTGISGGAALDAALALSRKEENSSLTIVAILPDTGERYLSTWLWNG
jgi:cysteine synthase A